MFRDLPDNFDDDDAAELRKVDARLRLREAIAQHYLAIQAIPSTDDRRAQFEQLNAFLEDMYKNFGPELERLPLPDKSFTSSDDTLDALSTAGSSAPHPDASSPASKGSSTDDCALQQFVWKFLTVGQDTWPVMQV
ncbi:unnamed protein product [Effrenium voratum]|uniref:Uncharacterized protein n=1 Tax=Effrenium voratum TaxID=2562239 RepID=A0AA36NM52_9DINO|nr:unnamed protein product [Effrenium voratum]